MSNTTGMDNHDEWIQRVLGYSLARQDLSPQKGKTASGREVRFAVVDEVIPSGQRELIGRRDGLAPIASSLPVGSKSSFKGANGKTLDITIGTDGRVALTAPPPPLREVTFSGGGGKGAALPGAVKAMERTGVLAEVQVFNGASVGSMTAALLAAGVTADEFKAISNDPETGKKIGEGRSRMGLLARGIAGDTLKGDNLEHLVSDAINESVEKKVTEFEDSGTQDKEGLAAARGIKSKVESGGKVTFGDLRTLSKLNPAVKEVVISGTYIGIVDGRTREVSKTDSPQVAIFSADTEPDLAVAEAVHASAALPPVFEPVDLKLSALGGQIARFQDGGVLNNAPTSDSIGAKRSLDPIPDAGKMNFVFQEPGKSDQVLEGTATPAPNAINDYFTKAPNAASEYAKNRLLADHPEDVVEVPLKWQTGGRKLLQPWKKKEKDFTGLFGGTVNMNMSLEDKLDLQSRTEDVTFAHITKRQQPQTREFASVKQMLNCLGRDDLAAVAADGLPGAKEELQFRDTVTDTIGTLVSLAAGAKADALKSGPLHDALKLLDDLAGGDVDRQGFIAREINRSGRLDPLMDLVKANGNEGMEVLDAGVAVAEMLRAKDHAQVILRDVVYPKLIQLDPGVMDRLARRRKGILAGREVLIQVDAILRDVKGPEDVNEALEIAIAQFDTPKDGDQKFAAELKSRLMRV